MVLEISTVLTVVVTVVGATWVLANKLGEIAAGLRAHVEKDEVEHRAFEARVISLEAMLRKDRR